MNKEEVVSTFLKLMKDSGFVCEQSGRVILARWKNDSQIYFQLIDDGQDENPFYRLEFWIDSYSNDRLAKQAKLKDVANNNRRVVEYLSYYNARGVRLRQRITSKNDCEDDVKLFLNVNDKSGMINFLFDENKSADVPSNGDTPTVGITVKSVFDILSMNIRIPEYQRPYEWEDSRIVGLLDDSREWLASHPDKSRLYRIGTIVLRKTKTENNVLAYDVVDGQQRLITLALLSRCAASNGIGGKFKLGTANLQKKAVEKIKHAINLIEEWKKIHGDGIDLKRLELSTIVIGESLTEDIAFRFFNHLNSSGMPLSDYDLLKSHHLRYIKGVDLSRDIAQRWNRFSLTPAHGVDGGRGATCDLLIQKMLFRIRKWLRKEEFKIEANGTDDRDIFNEFVSASVPYKLEWFSPRSDFVIASRTMEGLDFFEYVEKYRAQCFLYMNEGVVDELIKILFCHSYGTLCEGILALGFLFYEHFGTLYLADALYGIAYRASKLRNEAQVRRRVLATEDVFKDIAQLIYNSTREDELLGCLLSRTAIYPRSNSRPTAKAYWLALDEFMKCCMKRSSRIQENGRVLTESNI